MACDCANGYEGPTRLDGMGGATAPACFYSVRGGVLMAVSALVTTNGKYQIDLRPKVGWKSSFFTADTTFENYQNEGEWRYVTQTINGESLRLGTMWCAYQDAPVRAACTDSTTGCVSDLITNIPTCESLPSTNRGHIRSLWR
jgi:hypothetical protein